MTEATAGTPVHVRVGTDADLNSCLDVLNRSYGTSRFTEAWFEWKHRSCPFGASRIWLADGPEGVEGLFFALPWQYRLDGHTVGGVRTVDGATLPPARGRRVLGTLIRHEYEQWGPPGRPGVLVATATEDARRSHIRNGAIALPPLQYAYCVPRFVRAARLDTGGSVLDDYAAPLNNGMGTQWSPAALRWRTDSRSGNTYEAACLKSADQPNGIVYRTTRIGPVRVLIPITAWGGDTELRRLLSSVAAIEHAPVLLAPTGAGAVPMPLKPVRRAGHAWVCIWDRRDASIAQVESPLGSLAGWSLTYGELEGLI